MQIQVAGRVTCNYIIVTVIVEIGDCSTPVIIRVIVDHHTTAKCPIPVAVFIINTGIAITCDDEFLSSIEFEFGRD